MLYSISWIENRRDERRVFYGDSEEEVIEDIRLYAERTRLDVRYLKIEKHPRGLWLEGKFWPVEERKRNA